MTTPPATPPTIPLTVELRASYQCLYKTYETTIENTTDPGALATLNASQANVDDILTKDAMYRLHANAALYDALCKQIDTTNDELEKLKAQIKAISTGVSTFGDILAAIDKVLTFFPIP